MKQAAAIGVGALAFVAWLGTRGSRFRVAIVPLDWDHAIPAEELHRMIATKLKKLGASNVQLPKTFGLPIVASSRSRVLSPGSRLFIDDGAIVAEAVDASNIF